MSLERTATPSTGIRGWLRDLLPEGALTRFRRARLIARYERCRLAWARQQGGTLRHRGTVVYYPQLPAKDTTMFRLAAANGFRITDDLTVDAPLVRWMDRTVWASDGALQAAARDRRVVNLDAEDLTKSRVNEVFGEVFGYDVSVDPMRHEGPMVAKSEINAAHDGRIVEGPIDAPEPGVVYQRLIDSPAPDHPGTFEVLRTPMLGGRIPVVFRKLRSVIERLTAEADLEELVETDDVFSGDEQRCLAEFAATFGLDYGEMDILRDVHDGRIYVVDVNNTPWGPAELMTPPEIEEAIHRLAPELRRLLALDA